MTINARLQNWSEREAAMGDPRVDAAIAHWAPRYVEDGIPVGDFQEVSRSVERWEDWCSAWTARGGLHEAEGDSALAAGRRKSASFHFTTAAACYHFGKFLNVHDMAELRATHELVLRAHRKAHDLLEPPIERCEFPYGTHTLVGNLRKPGGIDLPPVVLMMPGLDSAKEELDYYAKWFHERGMATFAIDGPGQGEAEYDLPIEPHYEKPASAAVDFLESRPDIDSERLGAWGVSLGGYYVVRAAAFEPRIKALVSLSGPFDALTEQWDMLPEISRLTWQVRAHAATEEETLEVARKFDLSAVVGNVTCPAYIVGGELDRIISPEASKQIAAGVSGPSVLNLVKGGNHVVNNKAYMYRPQSADWMAEQLGAAGG
jgi:2,6-dihydroxypseudooxynicotine hydrolase